MSQKNDWFMQMVKNFEIEASQTNQKSLQQGGQHRRGENLGEMYFTSKNETIARYVYPTHKEAKISHIFPVDKNLFNI